MVAMVAMDLTPLNMDNKGILTPPIKNKMFFNKIEMELKR